MSFFFLSRRWRGAVDATQGTAGRPCVSAEVTGLTFCYATYDARFRDTNLKRFRGEAEEEFDEDEPPPPATKPRSLVYRGVHFRNLAVRLVARSPFGARHLGTIQLRDETADLEKFQVPDSNVRLDPGPGGARRGECWF